MALLIPETPKECPNGERLVFERLARDLDDDWVVLHSLGLVQHQKKLWGEADFVLLTTRGIFAIEVKGGRISCRDGEWIHEAPGREPYRRKESPWTQAKDAMYAVIDSVINADKSLAGLLFGYGVIMPHERFTMTGPEIELDTLLNADSFRRHLGFYIGDLQRYWAQAAHERQNHGRRLPTKEDVRKIRAILRPDIESTFSLGSYFTGLKKEQLQLTNGQIRAARGVANNPRTLIRGRAGTGKTIIAIDHARRQAECGKSVLYICFNQFLAKHVAESLKDERAGARIHVQHVHSLYRDVIERAGLKEVLEERKSDRPEFFAQVFPEVFLEAAFLAPPDGADVLVIDEAQDLLTMEHLDAFDMLLEGGLRKGQWHMYLDPMQDIYGKASEKAGRFLAEVGFAEYDLYENCRNTRQVAVHTSIISGMDMALEGALDGPETRLQFYRNSEDLVGKLDHCVRNLLVSDVLPGQMILLSPRRIEHSSLAGCREVADLRLVKLGDQRGVTTIDYATIHSFKGLERDVAIVVDVDHIGEESMSMIHYAGLSRARGLLCVFLPESERKAYQRQAQSFGARVASGRMG